MAELRKELMRLHVDPDAGRRRLISAPDTGSDSDIPGTVTGLRHRDMSATVGLHHSQTVPSDLR